MNSSHSGLWCRFAPWRGLLVLCLLVGTLPLAGQSLQELRQRQKADQKRLLDYYDSQALKECPKGPDGKINKASPEYKKLLNDYKRAHRKLNEVYRKKDPRLTDLKTETPGLKNSGSTPKNIESDVDWTAETDEAFQKKKKQWEARGDKLEVEGHKVVNKTTDETLWEPGTKAGDDALVKDGDAHGTEGGRKDVAGGNNVSDSEGSNLDRKKKHLDAQKRGNLKDQSKVAVKGAEEHGRSNRTIDQAKEYKNYGDSVTSGVSDLGDDAETRAAKEKEFAKKVEAEVDQNVAEGERKGKRTDHIREKIQESAKKAENSSGNKEWDEAKKKANYGDQKTTSEAIQERRDRVEESNRKTREEIDRRTKELDADSKNAGTAEDPKTKTDAPETKTKVEPEAPKTRTEVPETKPRVEVDTPKTKVEVPDTPKTKIETPDGPKIKVENPKMGDGLKKAAGDGLDAIDIFSTSEDVKQDFKEGKFKEGATKAGEAILDEVTVGGYSGAKTIKAKKEDLEGKDRDMDDTNANLREQHDQKLRVELRKSGLTKEEVNSIQTTDGLEHALRKRGGKVPEKPVEIQYIDKGDEGVEQIKKQISEEHKGNMRDQLVESGKMTREEADKLQTEAGLEHAMKRNELKIPEKRESGFIEVDDSLDERIEQVGEGIKTNVKKAGKFVKETGEDLGEIGAGLTEEGVAKQAYENSKENAKGWLETWEEERKSEKFTGDNKEGMIDYLEKRGASPVGARKAAEDFYGKGDATALENLDDTLRYKDAVKEAERRGEEIPSKEEFDKVSQSLKAKKERKKEGLPLEEDLQGTDSERTEDPSPKGEDQMGEDHDKSEKSKSKGFEIGQSFQPHVNSGLKNANVPFTRIYTDPDNPGGENKTKEENTGQADPNGKGETGEGKQDGTEEDKKGEEDEKDEKEEASGITKKKKGPVKKAVVPDTPRDPEEAEGTKDPGGEGTPPDPAGDIWSGEEDTGYNTGEVTTGEDGSSTTVKGWVMGEDGSKIVLTETRDADGKVIKTSDVEVDAEGKETGRTDFDGNGAAIDGLMNEEGENQGDWDGQEEDSDQKNVLGDYTRSKQEERQQDSESGFSNMEVRNEMQEASQAGNDDRRQAKTERNQAGEDARDTRDDSNRVVVEGDRENSWGKTLGDALEDGLTTGLKTAGQEFGNAAAEEVIDEIWKPEPTPAPPPPRPAGGSGGASGSSGGSGGGSSSAGMVSQGGGNPGGAPVSPGNSGGGTVDPDALENEPGTVDPDALENEPGPSAATASSGGNQGPIYCPKCGGTSFGPYEKHPGDPRGLTNDRRCLTCGNWGGIIGTPPKKVPTPTPTPVPKKYRDGCPAEGCGAPVTYKWDHYLYGSVYHCSKGHSVKGRDLIQVEVP